MHCHAMQAGLSSTATLCLAVASSQPTARQLVGLSRVVRAPSPTSHPQLAARSASCSIFRLISDLIALGHCQVLRSTSAATLRILLDQLIYPVQSHYADGKTWDSRPTCSARGSTAATLRPVRSTLDHTRDRLHQKLLSLGSRYCRRRHHFRRDMGCLCLVYGPVKCRLVQYHQYMG